MRIPLRGIAEAAWIADNVVFLASAGTRYVRGMKRPIVVWFLIGSHAE